MAAAPRGMNRFYLILGVLALAGIGVLAWMASGGSAPASIPANVAIQPSDTAGFRGYTLGRADAPVEVVEYADYECPACQQFEVVQFPAVRRQLIETGKVRWVYRDFPLEIHRFARLAAHAAACADAQGKFWEMHDRIYQGHSDWSQSGNAAPLFRDYAEAVGVDTDAYDACMESTRFAGRIAASVQEGAALGVGSTPSFVIGGRIYPGAISSDQIRRIADSLAARGPAPAGTTSVPSADTTAAPAASEPAAP